MKRKLLLALVVAILAFGFTSVNAMSVEKETKMSPTQQKVIHHHHHHRHHHHHPMMRK